MKDTTADTELVNELLIAEKDGAVGYLRFNRPEKHNAITYEMWQGISQVIDDFDADERVRVVVVSGEGGRAFSAGADISQFEQKRGSASAIEVYNTAVGQAQQKLTHLPKPTIAKIMGYCIGGGLAIALCCDLRFATDDSKFGIPAAKLGLGYGYDGLRPLVELVGPTRAKEILFTARHFNAAEAYDMSLINRVLTKDELDGFVSEYTQAIAGNAPLTIKACKQIIAEILKGPTDRDLELCRRLIDDCYASEDYKEGRRAFMEKRKPAFRGQ